MKQPLSQAQLYEKLGQLAKQMKAFKEKKDVKLSAEDIQLMIDVYDDVRVLSSGAMPLRIQHSCQSCISEAMHIFVSLYDRMSQNPLLNPDADPEGYKDTTDYSDQLPKRDDPNEVVTYEQPVEINSGHTFPAIDQTEPEVKKENDVDPEFQTPAQKAAATRKANAEKKAAEQK